MGGRGGGSGLGVGSSSSSNTISVSLKPGQLGNRIGSERDSSGVEWLAGKNLSQQEIQAINISNGSLKDTYEVAKETEKAKLLQWDTDFGKVSMWAPKSVIDKQVNTYDQIGDLKIGAKVQSTKYNTKGTVSKITDTHTTINTNKGNNITIKNSNVNEYYKPIK